MNERLLRFGDHDSLMGTLTLPESPAASADTPCFVLFNSGFIHRIGPHRLNVRLARALARAGKPSFRFDFSGLGDSLRSTSASGDETRSASELSAALTALTSLGHGRRFVLVGLCSGTDHCLTGALQDARVAGIVLLDPWTYPTLRTRYNFYAGRARELLASGQLLATIARKLAPGRSTAGNASNDPGESIQLRTQPSRMEFERWIRAILDKGTRILAVYSGGFPEDYNYASQFRDSHGTFGDSPLLDVRYIGAANHTFTDLSLQEMLLAAIVGWSRQFR